MKPALFNSMLSQSETLNVQYIYSIRKHLSLSLSLQCAKQLCYSMVLFHLNYATWFFAGLPDCTISKMQKIQNLADKVVLIIGKYKCSKSALKVTLAAIQQRLNFKILLVVFKALHGA